MELALVHSNKILRGRSKYLTPLNKDVASFVFHGGIANQVHNQSDTKLQFHLDTYNACCIQVHKAKYSMNVQYPILCTLE
jgi:hypothetical protein